MDYAEAMAYVSSLAPRGWRLGLDRMAEFARRAGLMGLPQRYLHVGGTNGKGSVTAYLQHILVASGYRTGAFFSPYVYDPRERIQVGLEMISEAAFAAICTVLRPIEESLSGTPYGGVTEFEMKTAIGLAHWYVQQCEYVALEVGLGGRLDSTNIVHPVVSAIVSIGLDHTAILGNTYEEIAYEKAGIIKPGVPVVVGEMPPGAKAVILREAEKRGSQAWRVGTEVLYEMEEGGLSVRTPVGAVDRLQLGLVGERQPHNVSVAIAAVHAAGVATDPDAIRDGVLNTALPGRMERRQWRGREVILDGAHNGEAAETLARTLAGRRFSVVAGMVSGHDAARLFKQIADIADAVFLSPIDFHRARNPIELAAELQGIVNVVALDSVGEALQAAHATGLPILVMGSFYLVGEAGRWMATNP